MPKGRLVFDGDNIYTEKDARIYKLKNDISSKIDWIPWVVDSLDSTSSTDALSANMGRQLQDQINSLSWTWKFLSTWNAVTWLPGTNPQEDPYTYKVGDYYVVSTTGSTNYKPHWGTYTQWVPSTTVETENVWTNDKYYFDGADWVRIPDTAIQIWIDSALSTTSTNAVENRVVTNALNQKQATISDLAAIRSWAAAGSTALQRLANISELTNNLGYQTAWDVAVAISWKANTSDVTALAWRVTTAEWKISTLETSSADYASRISNLESSSWSASQDIADLQGDVTSIQGDITSLQWDVSSLQTTVGNHTTSITTLQGDISSLQSAVAWKQDTLVSGTNIKTINNQSLLWSGDISINWILSWPIVPAASAQWAGKIYFCTFDNVFYKCDWITWTEIWSAWTSIPEYPTAWTIYYDTTNNVLKLYNWTTWEEIWSSLVSDVAFWSSWDWDTTHAPSKNAIYDVLGDVETLLANL